MNTKLTEVTYDVHLAPGEMLSLPEDAVEILVPGHWIVSIRPAEGNAVRNHSAFLNSYAPEDEGRYNDYPAG